nr:uncharacterized protein LOC109152077 [Ipomoea batatas]
MPLLRAAIFDESVFSLNWDISFSSFSISSLYFCKLSSAFNFIISSLDLKEVSICSLSFLSELACESNSSFAIFSCFHLACELAADSAACNLAASISLLNAAFSTSSLRTAALARSTCPLALPKALAISVGTSSLWLIGIWIEMHFAGTGREFSVSVTDSEGVVLTGGNRDGMVDLGNAKVALAFSEPNMGVEENPIQSSGVSHSLQFFIQQKSTKITKLSRSRPFRTICSVVFLQMNRFLSENILPLGGSRNFPTANKLLPAGVSDRKVWPYGVETVSELCGDGTASPENTDQDQMELDKDKGDNTKSRYKPALIKKTEEPTPLMKEKYGACMFVTRKDRITPRKLEQKNFRNGTPTLDKPHVPKNRQTIYKNQLFNSRFAPISDLDEDGLETGHVSSPRRQLLHSESSRAPTPGYSTKENLTIPFSPPKQLQGVRCTQNASNRGRGGRLMTPRQAAAQKEHTVVRGSTKGREVSKTTVQHRRTTLELFSPTASECLDYFDYDTPKELMDEDGTNTSNPMVASDLHELN